VTDENLKKPRNINIFEMRSNNFAVLFDLFGRKSGQSHNFAKQKSP